MNYCLKQGVNLDLRKQGRKIVSKGILVIQNLTKEDAGREICVLFNLLKYFLQGDYECVAENDKGFGVSSPVHIRVLCK